MSTKYPPHVITGGECLLCPAQDWEELQPYLKDIGSTMRLYKNLREAVLKAYALWEETGVKYNGILLKGK